MPSQLEKSRLAAFHRQGGLCYYCNFPLWLDDQKAFRARYLLSAAQHASRRCTAEHLMARRDGGSDKPDNIVAACWVCNVRRHRGRLAVTPDQHRRHVQRRLRRGAWLPEATLRALSACSRAAQSQATS